MGLGGENGKVETWEVGKSKGVKKKKKKEVVEAKGGVGEEEIGCWVRLRFLGSCISSRSKVDSSISGTTTHYGNFYFIFCENLVFLNRLLCSNLFSGNYMFLVSRFSYV